MSTASLNVPMIHPSPIGAVTSSLSNKVGAITLPEPAVLAQLYAKLDLQIAEMNHIENLLQDYDDEILHTRQRGLSMSMDNTMRKIRIAEEQSVAESDKPENDS